MKAIFGLIFATFISMSLPAQAALDNANNKNVSVIEMASISSAGDVYGLHLPEGSVVTSVYVADAAGIAADNTNYVTLKLMNGSTEMASYDSRAANQGALVANTPKKAILSSGVVAAGSYLKVAFAKGGTGAMTTGKVFIQWYEK